MRRRKKTSGGQAIVMVTLALIAMCGMMGLAVDLGWSFFVQKEGQAAADGAALAAVQEAYKNLTTNLSSLNPVTCGAYAACPVGVPNPAPCSGISTGNLYSACLYAKANGFDPATNVRQQVTIQANNTALTGSLGVTDVSYWVTVRTVQTIPQLFSSVLNNTEGTISAVATAGLVREAFTASFLGLNRASDCTTTATGAKANCGVDVNLSGTGGTCVGGAGSYHMCAPGGVLLASTCNGTSQAGCGTGGTGNNYAGTADVLAPTTQIQGIGKVNPNNPKWTPTTNGGSGAQFADPTIGLSQPPLAATSAPPSCGIQNGNINVNLGQTLTLGPYQYYAYNNLSGGKPVPSGAPVTINPNQQPGQVATVNFSSTSGTCPGVLSASGASQSGQAFPTYIFYGGLTIGPNTSQLTNTFGTSGSASVNFGPGQYVMAGTTSSSGYVFSSIDSNLTATSSAGSLFVFTNGNYSSGVAGAANLSDMMATAVPNSGSIPPCCRARLWWEVA